MTLKKKYLTLFYLTLSQSKLNKLSDARIRDGLVTKKLYEELKDYEQARVAIYKEFCIKNEDGTPKLNKDNEFEFAKEDINKLNYELNVLMEEEIDLPINNQAKIKQFIENTSYEPKVGEVEIIDELLNLMK